MVVGGTDQTSAIVPAGPSLAPDLFGIPNINPATGLSTDYLNHFTEAVMALEMVTTMPDCLPDLRTWEPKTYCEHFETSHFTNRNYVIAAYYAAPPKVREDLNAAAETLNAVLEETRDAVLAQLSTPVARELAMRAVAWLKPLIVRTAAVINGAASLTDQDGHCTQAAVDALFAREQSA